MNADPPTRGPGRALISVPALAVMVMADEMRSTAVSGSPLAEAPVKVIEPKLARGWGLHFVPPHTVGASAIHSAEAFCSILGAVVRKVVTIEFSGCLSGADVLRGGACVAGPSV